MKDRLFSYRWLSTGAVPGLAWVGVYISLLSQRLGGFSWHVVACTQGHLTSYNVGGLSSPMKNFLFLQNFQKSSIILRKTVGNNMKPLRGLNREVIWPGRVQTGPVVQWEGPIQKEGSDTLRKIRRPQRTVKAWWRDEDPSQQQQEEGWQEGKEGGHWEANSRDI